MRQNNTVYTKWILWSWYWFLITVFLVVKTIRKPKIMVPQLKLKYSGIRHYLFEKRYHPFVAGIAVGFIITLLAWPMSESTGRMGET